ncbi:MAG: stage II sporulation protein M [Anaerolineae bacterium]
MADLSSRVTGGGEGSGPEVAMLAPVLIIARREIKDTLRDWRIVLPILSLVAGFPLLATFVASRGVDFLGQYGADIILERLYPFLILVVGFFPSTFSLVIALETFVGERERRSLEPLLTTPLTDLQLYLGKLLAATLPSIAASYLGMGIYTVMLGTTVGWWPEPSLMVLALALATVEAVVMVAGAVIVSSQSTSVRAANLVASFIIIPMALLLQAEAGLLLFANYTALWLVALALAIVALLLVRLGIRIFNRETLLGRDLDELNLRAGATALWEGMRPEHGIVRLYRREIPRLLRSIRPELLVTLLVLGVGGMAIGVWARYKFPLPLGLFDLNEIVDEGAFDQLVAQTGLLPSFSVLAVFLHNVRALLAAAILGGLSLGTLATILLMAPIALIAYLGLQVGQLGLNPWLFIAVAVLPHGIFELPAAIIATAQAVRVGAVILRAPSEGGGVLGILREAGHFVKLFVALVLPLLVLAAWIEVAITPKLLLWLLATRI